jgi:hypothetical protein
MRKNDKDADWILSNLKNNIQFALARFNDGEMMGIADVGSVVARGDQYVDQSLSTSLKEAIQYKQKNYYIGIPCSLCYPKHHKLAIDLIGDYEHLTRAVVATNRNWKHFVDNFSDAVNGRRVVWIGGTDQNVDGLEKIGLKVAKRGLVPRKNSWRYYEHILKTFPKQLRDGDVVCISLGPTARMLVKEWFKEMPNITFMDVGSTFDPFTRNVYFAAHRGWDETGFNFAKPCSECN